MTTRKKATTRSKPKPKPKAKPAAPKPAAAQPPAATSIELVAAHFGVNRRTINEWLSAGCPGRSADGYDLQRIAAWRAENRPPKVTAETEEESGKKSRSYWAKRKERAAALREELELARERGELIEVDVVARIVARHITDHNSRADNLRDRLLQLFPTGMKSADRKRILDGLEKAIDDLRNSMAESIEELEKEFARGRS